MSIEIPNVIAAMGAFSHDSESGLITIKCNRGFDEARCARVGAGVYDLYLESPLKFSECIVTPSLRSTGSGSTTAPSPGLSIQASDYSADGKVKRVYINVGTGETVTPTDAPFNVVVHQMPAL